VLAGPPIAIAGSLLPVELAFGLVLNPAGGANVDSSRVFEKAGMACVGATNTTSRTKVDRIAEPRVRMAILLAAMAPAAQVEAV